MQTNQSNQAKTKSKKSLFIFEQSSVKSRKNVPYITIYWFNTTKRQIYSLSIYNWHQIGIESWSQFLVVNSVAAAVLIVVERPPSFKVSYSVRTQLSIKLSRGIIGLVWLTSWLKRKKRLRYIFPDHNGQAAEIYNSN